LETSNYRQLMFNIALLLAWPVLSVALLLRLIEGLKTFGLPLAVGVPSAGGAIALRSGVALIAASQDRYLRAYETQSGRELWKARLPAGGQATPITYLSKPSGRQFVVVAAGGHAGLATRAGDYVLGYALP